MLAKIKSLIKGDVNDVFNELRSLKKNNIHLFKCYKMNNLN